MADVGAAFDLAVEGWMLDALSRPGADFARLLERLPGVYPSEALRAVGRLVARRHVDEAIAARIVRESRAPILTSRARHGAIVLPVAHPLDYAWRFDDATAEALADVCLERAREGVLVALLGTPTIFRVVAERGGVANVVLFDQDEAVVRRLRRAAPAAGRAEQCDLLADPIPALGASLVICDPPWYDEHLRGFLWAAARLCRPGGTVLLSVPPHGTRPGIEGEWTEICLWAARTGLALERVDERALNYETPTFEHNALHAEGILGVPRVWRRATSARFRRTSASLGPRPPRPPEEAWDEFDIRGTRIRVRAFGARAFLDPALRPVGPDEVLSSVSRRDPLRREVDVWTSGNRGYCCRGRFVLRLLLAAMINGWAAHDVVAAGLGRPLGPRERDAIDHAVRSVDRLCGRERLERGCQGE